MALHFSFMLPLFSNLNPQQIMTSSSWRWMDILQNALIKVQVVIWRKRIPEIENVVEESPTNNDIIIKLNFKIQLRLYQLNRNIAKSKATDQYSFSFILPQSSNLVEIECRCILRSEMPYDTIPGCASLLFIFWHKTSFFR